MLFFRETGRFERRICSRWPNPYDSYSTSTDGIEAHVQAPVRRVVGPERMMGMHPLRVFQLGQTFTIDTVDLEEVEETEMKTCPFPSDNCNLKSAENVNLEIPAGWPNITHRYSEGTRG